MRALMVGACFFAAGLVGTIAEAAEVHGDVLAAERAGTFPLPYVAVTLTGRSGQPIVSYTGSDGRYYFFGVAPGRYTVRVWPEGEDAGEPVSRNIQVSAGTEQVPSIVIGRE